MSYAIYFDFSICNLNIVTAKQKPNQEKETGDKVAPKRHPGKIGKNFRTMMLSLVTFRSIYRTLIIQLMVLVQYTRKPFVSGNADACCWINIVRLVKKECGSSSWLRFCRKTLLHTRERLSRIRCRTRKWKRFVRFASFSVSIIISYLSFSLILILCVFHLHFSFGRATIPMANQRERKRRWMVGGNEKRRSYARAQLWSSETNWAGALFGVPKSYSLGAHRNVCVCKCIPIGYISTVEIV